MLAFTVVPPVVSAQSGGQQTQPYYCWVTGLVADRAAGRDDASFGGARGYPFAAADRYVVEPPPGEHWYVHMSGSRENDLVKYDEPRRYGPLFGDLHNEAVREAGELGNRDCQYNAAVGIERLFYRTGDGVRLAPDLAGPGDCPLDLVDFEAYGVADGGDFEDYAGTWSDLYGYWGQDRALTDRVLWRPFARDASGNDGLIKPEAGYFIAGVSHTGRAALAEFLWQGDAGSGISAADFGDGSKIADWNADGAKHLTKIWGGVADDSLAWAFRSVAIPDDRPVQSLQAKWITGSSALGGDEVDQAKLLREQTAAQAELAARNVTRTGGGNEISQQVGQDTVYAISGTLTASGGAGTTTRAQFDSRQVAVTSTAQWTEVVNQEQDVASLAGQGRVDNCVVDSAGNCSVQPTTVDSDLGVQNLEGLGDTAGSLRPERYVDGDDDELHLVIVLRDQYRADFAWASVGRFGASPGLGERVGGGDAASLTRSHFWKSYLTAMPALPMALTYRRSMKAALII